MQDYKTYTDEQKHAQIEKAVKNCKPLCVLGVLGNEKGNKIMSDMLQWLLPVYHVHICTHDGSRFELPALQEAKRVALEYDVPVLYIHTRGAVNEWPTTAPTHRMWRREFGDQWRKYFTLASADAPLVVAPFVDAAKTTRYNGFVANPAAWAKVDLQPTADRMDYERLWRGMDVPVIGTLLHAEESRLKEIHKILYALYE